LPLTLIRGHRIERPRDRNTSQQNDAAEPRGEDESSLAPKLLKQAAL
jgi:hypothetical protein